ncbi:MAG TPA: inositol monophosphatase [Candidatus Dormibacteraeota bacterium]|nr:inositol monophosphatase [Candidatus Dormibacteraeota bacterium]
MRVEELRAEASSAVQAVRAALHVVAERIDSDQITSKGRLDIATGTDVKSQAVIRALVTRTHGDHAFVGEESGQDAVPADGSYWLVDPICGTWNFASHLPLCCVNVALVEEGQVVLGAVGDAASGEIWVSQRGRGTWLAEATELVPTTASDASSILVLEPGLRGGAEAMRRAGVMAAAVADGQWELRTLGSTIDLAYVAAGRVAGAWHPNTSAPLHFAAGALVASEAGALVTDEDGRPWTPRSHSLVAAATPKVHTAMLALVAARPLEQSEPTGDTQRHRQAPEG